MQLIVQKNETADRGKIVVHRNKNVILVFHQRAAGEVEWLRAGVIAYECINRGVADYRVPQVDVETLC